MSDCNLTIYNGVITGNDGYLFLAGGAHNPLKFINSKDQIKKRSVNHFVANIKSRAVKAERRGINYLHVICPDKHFACRKYFPTTINRSLFEAYVEHMPSDFDFSNIVYPLQELEESCVSIAYKTDTHYTPHGTAVATNQLLLKFQIDEKFRLHSSDLNTSFSRDDFSGDLGSKLIPKVYEKREILLPNSNSRKFSNSLGSGNNGIIDFYINDHAPIAAKILIFGDSFGRSIATCLTNIFSNVLFLRSPFVHIEIIDSYKPQYMITQNVERYLSHVTLDREAPPFFLYPFLKGVSPIMDIDSAQAISLALRGN
jgi:hypothetical protein